MNGYRQVEEILHFQDPQLHINDGYGHSAGAELPHKDPISLICNPMSTYRNSLTPI